MRLSNTLLGPWGRGATEWRDCFRWCQMLSSNILSFRMSGSCGANTLLKLFCDSQNDTRFDTEVDDEWGLKAAQRSFDSQFETFYCTPAKLSSAGQSGDCNKHMAFSESISSQKLGLQCMSSERGGTIQSPKHGCSFHVRSLKLQNNLIEKTVSMNTDEKAGIQQVQRVWANTLERKRWGLPLNCLVTQLSVFSPLHRAKWIHRAEWTPKALVRPEVSALPAASTEWSQVLLSKKSPMATRGTAALGTCCPSPECRYKIKMLSNTNTPKGQDSLIAREKNRREGKAFLSQHYGVTGQDDSRAEGAFLEKFQTNDFVSFPLLFGTDPEPHLVIWWTC